MNERKIIRELTKIFSVNETDLPKTIQRFKDEAEQMKKELKEMKKTQ